MTDAQRLSGEQSSRSVSRHSMDSIKKQADELDSINNANNTNNNNNNSNKNNNENNNSNENNSSNQQQNDQLTENSIEENNTNQNESTKNQSSNNDKSSNHQNNSSNTDENTNKSTNNNNKNSNDNNSNENNKENNENNNENQNNKNNRKNSNSKSKSRSKSKSKSPATNKENNGNNNNEKDDENENDNTTQNTNGAKSKESTPISNILTKARKSGDHTPRDANNNDKLDVINNNNNNNNDENDKNMKKINNNNGTGIELSDSEKKRLHEKNKQDIFCKYTKVARTVCAYLQLSQIIAIQHTCVGSRKMVDTLYRDFKTLDLSEYYGTIGSPEFDSRTFFKVFLPKWKNVERLSLRYCSHLQASHLDRMITAITPEPESENEQKSDNQQNTKLKHLNLYFCSKLGSNTLLKIRNRLKALESLNIGRCYLITAHSNYNAFKQLIGSPIKSLTFSLDPSILKDEAMDVVSDLIHEQSFPNLEEVDLSHGCQILNEVDLSDLQTRVKKLILPKKVKDVVKKNY